MLTESIKARVDSKKPRQEGLTYIIDKLEGLDKELKKEDSILP